MAQMQRKSLARPDEAREFPFGMGQYAKPG